jgi:lipoprotein-anchoring transpeptidase ErfK/SrfK
MKSATRRLASALGSTENRRLVVRAGPQRLVVVPAKAGVMLDPSAIAKRAVSVSRGGSFISRDVRALTGGHVKKDIAAVLGPGSSRAVSRLAAQLDQAPQNAAVHPGPAGVTLAPSQAGTRVRRAALGASLASALLSGAARATVPARRINPAVTTADLRRHYPSYITIDRGGFTLRVYQHLHLFRSYPIAVGMQGLQTPAGLYHIEDKEVDPSWQVPNSSWAGSLAGQLIPPGPQDPLKARWMGFFDGSGIHGTDETSSIGSDASHGCVRMLIPDVIDLYNRVQIGTPVYIGD